MALHKTGRVQMLRICQEAWFPRVPQDHDPSMDPSMTHPWTPKKFSDLDLPLMPRQATNLSQNHRQIWFRCVAVDSSSVAVAHPAAVTGTCKNAS